MGRGRCRCPSRGVTGHGRAAGSGDGPGRAATPSRLAFLHPPLSSVPIGWDLFKLPKPTGCLLKKKYLIKANGCKVKTWREQSFCGQRGAKRGPGGAPAREQMPLGDARPPAEAASSSAALPARARWPGPQEGCWPGAFAWLYGVMMAPLLPCLPPLPPSLCQTRFSPSSFPLAQPEPGDSPR